MQLNAVKVARYTQPVCYQVYIGIYLQLFAETFIMEFFSVRFRCVYVVYIYAVVPIRDVAVLIKFR